MKKRIKKEKKDTKLRRFIHAFKELWKQPRYHAMIKLGLYFIFVSGVLIFVQIAGMMNRNNDEVVEISPLEEFGYSSNYQYQIKLEEVGTILMNQEIIGKKDEVSHEFRITGDPKTYLIDNSVYYLTEISENTVIDNPTIIDINRLTPKLLEQLIKPGEMVANTTYKSGVVETTYELPISIFTELYTGTKIENDQKISIKIQVENRSVKQVILDLTNYRKIQDANLVNSNLTFSIIK